MMAQVLMGLGRLEAKLDMMMAEDKSEDAKEKEYAKFFKIKAGYVEGAVVDAEYIKALASIPSREILIARLLGSMQSPIAAFARVVNEIAKKKEEESASA